MINKLTEAVEKLDHQKAELERLIHARSALDFRGHQKSAWVSIGGIKIEITTSPHLGSVGVKRGYEMIHLGMQKIYNANIDACRAAIKKTQIDISNIAFEIAGDNNEH